MVRHLVACSCIYRITKTFRDKKLSQNAMQQHFMKKTFVKEQAKWGVALVSTRELASCAQIEKAWLC